MLPKPEVGIQFGAGGASSAAELEAQGISDPSRAIRQAKRYLEAGAHCSIMIESEGITEQVKSWRTDVPARFINELGLDKVMFEAADPEVFSWYVKSYGPEVNLFVDDSDRPARMPAVGDLGDEEHVGPRGDIQGKRESRTRRGVPRAAHRDPPEGQGRSMTPYRGAAAWRLDEPRTQAERLVLLVSRANRGDISPRPPGRR